MDTLKITHNNKTLEVVAKIMNSYALKYDCTVKYNAQCNSLDFNGKDIHKRTIAHETSYIISGN